MDIFNQFLQGDCRTLANQIPDNSVDLICADPPYYVMNKSNIEFNGETRIKLNVDFDTIFKSYPDYLRFIDDVIRIYVPKLKENAWVVLFFAVQYISDLIRIAKKYGLEFDYVVSWRKTNPPMKFFKTSFVSCMEYMVWFKRGSPTFNFLGQNAMHNCIEGGLISNKERVKNEEDEGLHPTQKPEYIIEYIVSIATNPYQVVCDPFGGVATTNVVCARLTRSCISCELNPQFYNGGLDRLNKIKSRIDITKRQKTMLEFKP